MAYSLTNSLKHNRWSVVDVDKEGGRLRVKGVENACTDLSCAGAVVVTQEGRTKDLDSVRSKSVALFCLSAGKDRKPAWPSKS